VDRESRTDTPGCRHADRSGTTFAVGSPVTICSSLAPHATRTASAWGTATVLMRGRLAVEYVAASLAHCSPKPRPVR
jgi:hypothetical protein